MTKTGVNTKSLFYEIKLILQQIKECNIVI